YGGVVDEFYAALYELNLPCDLIYDRETDWSPYRLLVFPQLYSASDAFIARVRDFTAKGGTVLASFRSFFADEHLRVWPDAQPHGLTDLFGMRYSRFTQDEAGRWMELLEPKQAAVAGRYGQPGWNGLPAATRCRFGKGHAWYLGTRLDSDALKDFLLRVCETAEIHVPSCRFPLVCRQATAADGAALWFFLNYAPEEARLRSPAAGTELLGGGRVSAGQMLSIEGWGAAILRADAAQ
ncbi:MAG: beta-galactosidase trimerization domain-containing protein, partial [Oscillospiraceae bacterium]|nr:beta-galactosidase trimerization domain-containing protein [Oscillospiraceae bacterium]